MVDRIEFVGRYQDWQKVRLDTGLKTPISLQKMKQNARIVFIIMDARYVFKIL
ncbi:MAG TPA: hypothetical protein VNE86_03070 [Nitrososphaerales archaeon]|nr:hypothetical protein [Nitrososphaerales archaeon]